MNFPAYPQYKDSCVAWLGNVPSHWQVLPLKHVAEVNAGQSPNSADCNQEGNGLPFLQGCAEFGDRNPSPRQYCDLSPKTARVGDILLSVRAPVGALNLADQSYGIGRGLCAVHATAIEHGFLWHALTASTKALTSVATGSTYLAVSNEQVGSLRLVLPPMEEQRLIAAFLDRETVKIDALVAEQERLIALLKEKRQAVISHAVTKGLNPNAPMKDSGIAWLGEIPAHWAVIALNRLVDPKRPITYGIVQPGEGDPSGRFMVRGQDYSKGWASPDDIFRVSDAIEVPYRRARLAFGDVVITIVGAGTGNTAVVPEFLDGANITQTTARVAPAPDRILSEYLSIILGSRIGTIQVALFQKGAAQPGLNLEHLKAFRFPIPTLDEQTEIVAALNKRLGRFAELVDEAQAAIGLLQERRAALISAAVTGKIDVRALAATPQELEIA